MFSGPHFSQGTESTAAAAGTATAHFWLGLRLRLGDIICKSEQRATPHAKVDRAEVARETVHLHHNADDPVLRHKAQLAMRRDALAFERSARAGGGLGERRRVLLRDFAEEHMAGVLAETGRSAQGRALHEFWEGKNPDYFECCTFAVADVLQSAQLECRLAQPGW